MSDLPINGLIFDITEQDGPYDIPRYKGKPCYDPLMAEVDEELLKEDDDDI